MPCMPRAASTTSRPEHSLRASSPPISLRPPRIRRAPCSVADLAELTWPLVQRLNAICGGGDDIFDTHSPLAWNINSRFDGKRHILLDDNRKSTRLNSSHVSISYAVFCLKKTSPDAVSLQCGIYEDGGWRR